MFLYGGAPLHDEGVALSHIMLPNTVGFPRIFLFMHPGIKFGVKIDDFQVACRFIALENNRSSHLFAYLHLAYKRVRQLLFTTHK